MRNFISLICFAYLALLTGCANFNSIHRDNTISKKRGEIVFTDAKQRGIITNPLTVKTDGRFTFKDGTEVPVNIESQIRMCSEAAPDVFSAYALSAAAKASAKVAEKSGEGEFSLSSVENASTIARTQTINMLREAMFRTCERYLSGAISQDELIVQSARDQRMIVSTLAIEQLTSIFSQIAKTGEDHSKAQESSDIISAKKDKLLSDESVRHVADAIKEIVESTYRFDEVMMTCVVAFREKNREPAPENSHENSLYNNCLGYLEKVVASNVESARRSGLSPAPTELDRIVVDVITSENADNQIETANASLMYWQENGFQLLTDTIGPDSVQIYEGKITGDPPDRLYRSELMYDKAIIEEPIVLIFIKG